MSGKKSVNQLDVKKEMGLTVGAFRKLWPRSITAPIRGDDEQRNFLLYVWVMINDAYNNWGANDNAVAQLMGLIREKEGFLEPKYALDHGQIKTIRERLKFLFEGPFTKDDAGCQQAAKLKFCDPEVAFLFYKAIMEFRQYNTNKIVNLVRSKKKSLTECIQEMLPLEARNMLASIGGEQQDEFAAQAFLLILEFYKNTFSWVSHRQRLINGQPENAGEKTTDVLEIAQDLRIRIINAMLYRIHLDYPMIRDQD